MQYFRYEGGQMINVTEDYCSLIQANKEMREKLDNKATVKPIPNNKNLDDFFFRREVLNDAENSFMYGERITSMSREDLICCLVVLSDIYRMRDDRLIKEIDKGITAFRR